jgi:lysophospholipase
MKKLLAISFVAFMISTQAMAISEQNYAQDMANKVMPFYATGVQGSFAGKDGIPISYIKFENPQEIGAIVIVNGRSENYAFYAEPIYDLAQAGYSIYAFDHRGQGFSGRLLANTQIGHVEHFDDYVDDMKTFVDTVVNTTPHTRRYIFSHSMGGAISAQYGLLYPTDFDAYVFSSPMFGFNTSPYSNFVAHVIVDFGILIGNARGWAKNQGPYLPTETFASNTVTTSELRWNTRHDVLIDNPVVQLGGPSNRWVQQALDATSSIRDNAHNFQPPAMVFETPTDQIVISADEEAFCSKASHCVMGNTYPNGKHELIREQDYIRTDLYQRALKFFSEN